MSETTAVVEPKPEAEKKPRKPRKPVVSEFAVLRPCEDSDDALCGFDVLARGLADGEACVKWAADNLKDGQTFQTAILRPVQTVRVETKTVVRIEEA
jgi:hypothetical protein